jgi:hypothetical protein
MIAARALMKPLHRTGALFEAFLEPDIAENDRRARAKIEGCLRPCFGAVRQIQVSLGGGSTFAPRGTSFGSGVCRAAAIDDHAAGAASAVAKGTKIGL